jgi:hypothetical protein
VQSRPKRQLGRLGNPKKDASESWESHRCLMGKSSMTTNIYKLIDDFPDVFQGIFFFATMTGGQLWPWC